MALDPSLLSGAINGTSDPTQNIFRRRAAVTPTPGAAPAPQGIASPAPSASDNGQGAIVAASGGSPNYDTQNVQDANAIAAKARTGGGNFDPAAPLPSAISSISPTLSSALDAPRTLVAPATPSNPAGDVASLRAQLPNETTRAGRDALNSKINTLLGAAVLGGAQQNSSPSKPAGIAGPVVQPEGGTPLSASGRSLGYGKVVNGVPTFSDGSGGPGAVPRTMSDDQIGALGGRLNTISSSNFSNPSVGTNGPAPALGSIASAPQSQYDPHVAAWNAEVDLENAQRSARSDALSITNEDPRSQFGVAARNARISLDGMRGGRTGRYTNAGSPYQGALDSLRGVANQQVIDATGAAGRVNELSRADIGQAGETQREGIKVGAEENRTSAELARKLDQYQTDPTTGQVSIIRNGIAAPVTDTSGKSFSVTPQVQKPDIKDILQGISGGLQIKDPNAQGGVRPATIDDVPAIMQQFNPKQAQPASGKTVGTATATGKDGTKYTLAPDGKSWVKANG